MRFPGFRLRYTAELGRPSSRAALGRLHTLADAGPLTLLTAAPDAERSHAAILADLLTREAAVAEDTGDADCWAHLSAPGAAQ